jgi:DGQHR domain-containing protein
MNIYPAMKARMGRWEYFIVKMTMREVSDSVKFASDIYDDKTLDEAIQRVLDESRSKKSIAGYLIRQPDRFFSSIVVAALKGNPVWHPLSMEDDNRFAIFKADARLSETFGVLTFDGGQDYYALDGQHRLRAIQALVDPHSDLSSDAPNGFKDEEISVIIVMPGDVESDDEFLQRYRRLFGNLNRYAKPMDQVTNIIMDEDDAFAIVTRDLITSHPFFMWNGRQRESQRIKMTKGKNLKGTDSYFTSLEALYEMNIRFLTSSERLNSGWDEDGVALKQFVLFRPSDEIIEVLSAELRMYWDGLLHALPQLAESPLENRDHAASPDGKTKDLAIFWPIGQELLVDLAREILNRRLPDPSEPDLKSVQDALQVLGEVDWRMHLPPWRHVLLIPDTPDMTSWKIRNEDRKDAQAICKLIVKWQIGLENGNRDFVESIRSQWERMLLPALDPSVVDDLWEQIEAGVIR